MGYIDLIPDVSRLTMPDLTTGSTYRTTKFNVGNKSCIGVTIKASQALSVAVAYGIVGDTAAAAGGSASLPYKTSATSFASSTGTEAGTYHEIAIPPHARQAQLVISNASGSTVSGAVIDAALRVVAYPASGGGGGSSAFGDITGWPGASTDFIRGDGSDAPLSATEIQNALDAGSGTASQMVRGDGTISALANGDLPVPGILRAPQTNSIGIGSLVDLTYGTPTVNTLNGTWTSNKTYTPSVSGWYWVAGGIFVSGSGSVGRVIPAVNGSSVPQCNPAAAGRLGDGTSYMGFLYLASGDTLKLMAIGAGTTSNIVPSVSDLVIAGPFFQ